MLFVHIRGATVRVEKKLAFYCLPFWAEVLPQLNKKAVHYFKTKSSGIILTP